MRKSGELLQRVKIWRMRIACWITKTINIHSQYIIFIAFPWQHLLCEPVPLLGYTYITCLLQLILEDTKTGLRMYQSSPALQCHWTFN